MEQPPVQPISEHILQSKSKDVPIVPTPEVNQKEKSTKWLIIILVLLFFGVFGVAGYFAYQNNKLKKQLYDELEIDTLPKPTLSPFLSLKPSIQPSPSTKPESAIPNDWRTYTYEKKGYYSIKYPPEVKVQEGPGSEERMQETNFTLFGPNYPGPGEYTDGFGITIAVINNSDNKTPNQLAQEYLNQAQQNIQDNILEGDFSKCKIEEVVRNNITGVRFNLCTKAPGSGVINLYEWFVVNKITYQVYGVLQNNKYLDTFNKVLSTLILSKCIDSNMQCQGKPDGTTCNTGIWCDGMGRVCGGLSCTGLGIGVCKDNKCEPN